MGIMSGNSKDDPMHYGEVIGCWAYVGANKGLISAYQTFINHAGDEDLKKLLHEAVDMMKNHDKQLEEVLKANGIMPPPTLPDRPTCSADDIPPGARFMDPEISGAISINIGQALVSCSQVMGQCLREDIATMFAKFHTDKVMLGAKLLKLNKEKGWIIPPPLHLNGKHTKE